MDKKIFFGTGNVKKTFGKGSLVSILFIFVVISFFQIQNANADHLEEHFIAKGANQSANLTENNPSFVADNVNASSGVGVGVAVPPNFDGDVYYYTDPNDFSTTSSDLTIVGNVIDIFAENATSPPPKNCSGKCDVLFVIQPEDILGTQIANLEDLNILHDANDDGDFDDPGEVLPTTLIDMTAGLPSWFSDDYAHSGGFLLRSDDVPSLSKFAIGGRPALFLGSVCLSDCIPPTLGVDGNSNRVVHDGFTYNGNPVDVDLFYTPYPLITVEVGQPNVAELKIFENRGPENIKHVSLAFGLGSGESFGKSKAIIKWDKPFFGSEQVTVLDPENALDNVTVQTEKDRCSIGSDQECLVVSIFHTFRAPLDFNMVATNVWDFRGNAWQNYYNHGIHIVGDSLNPPERILIHHGAPITLTLLDKFLGVDSDGNTWKNGNGYWTMEPTQEKTQNDRVTKHGIDRNNNMFKAYKQGQALVAHLIMEKILEGDIVPSDLSKKYTYGNMGTFENGEDAKSYQIKQLHEEQPPNLDFQASFDFTPAEPISVCSI